MRVLEGDLQLVSIFLQRAQEVLGEAAWNHKPAETVSGGVRQEPLDDPDSPSSSLLKDRLVVSSFKFLLKSMHKLLSFFLIFLISCCREEDQKVNDLRCHTHTRLPSVTSFPPQWEHLGSGEGKGHLLSLWGQVEAVPPPQFE